MNDDSGKIVLYILFFGGWLLAWLFENYLRHRFAAGILDQWQPARRTIQFEPVWAKYLGNMPQTPYRWSQASFGALGLVDDTLCYRTRGKGHDLVIPVSAIKWIGTHNVMVKGRKKTRPKHVLVIHYEETTFRYENTTTPFCVPLWRVATFVTPQNGPFLFHLSQITHLPYHQLGHQRYDFGPVDATHMQQNIYGHWHEKQHRPLYVAPDWLLFDYHHPLPLNQVRHIEVIARAGLLNAYPLGNDPLLRIQYRDHADQLQTVAYRTRNANALARKLSERSGVPYRTVAGRKKK